MSPPGSQDCAAIASRADRSLGAVSGRRGAAIGLCRLVYVQNMSVPVLVFASYADAFGARTVQAPITAPCTVSDVVNALRTLPGGERLPSRPMVAVNQSYAAFSSPVAPGDEVALIPPVAGG